MMATAIRDGLQRDQAEIRRQLRTCRDKQREKHRRRDFSAFTKQVAVLLLHKHRHAQAAVDWLEHREKIHKLPNGDEESRKALIEGWFLDMEFETLQALDAAWDELSTSIARCAHQWLERWKLSVWIENQNLAIGVAPSSSRVIVQRDTFLENLGRPESVKKRKICTVSNKDACWTYRFRQRFAMRMLRLRVRDEQTVETLRGKALPGVFFFPLASLEKMHSGARKK